MKTFSTYQQKFISFVAENPATPAALDAVAGSGKSHTLEGTIAAMRHKSILNLQFNKKNQLEMARRITDPRVTVSTMNAACNKFVTRNWGYLTAKSFWAEANRVNRLDSTCKGFALNQVTKLIDCLKCECVSIPTEPEAMKIALKYGIEDCTNLKFPLENIVSLAVKALPLALERPKNKQISWGDQIWIALIMGWLRQEHDATLGDEFQDFNPVQHASFLALAGKGQIGIAGDKHQQIYGWRGAKHGGIDSMVQAIGATVFSMPESFRCPQIVVPLVKPLVPHFEVHSNAKTGVLNQVSYDEAMKRAKEGDAFLSRTNAPLMAGCFAMLRQGISARIEGKEIGAQLESVIKQTGEAFEIIPFLDKLESWKQARIAKAKGYNADETIAFVTDQAATLSVLAENCNSVPEMIQKIGLLFEDSDGNQKPCVKFSTVHKAKGLEWDRVNLLEDTFKGRRGPQTEEQAQEEKNVRYVALTRTRDTLNLVNGLGTKAN